MNKNKIVLSAKVSDVQSLISVYQKIAKLSDCAIHLGLTEAGSGDKGIISSAIGIGILLHNGIGDTIRVSITPQKGENRSKEVNVCKEILQSLNIRTFHPKITSCPGCGRTDGEYFYELTEEIKQYVDELQKNYKEIYKGIENLKIAVMGCIVNGPGESKHADIGISLPGKGEERIVQVFIDGKKHSVIQGSSILPKCKEIILEYISARYTS